MTSTQPAQRPRRRARSTVIALVIVLATLTGLLGCRASGTSWSAARPLIDAPGPLRGDVRGAIGVSDGEVPDGVTFFDDGYPAVAALDPALLTAVRRAATDAGRDGVEVYVNSGWRSAAYQEALLRQAVSQYGSRAAAARWVATPATSPHVSGDAVDVGGTAATTWLAEHGSRYGLCRVYANEPWHFELRPEAVEHGCPPTYADPTHDPRMQQ